MQSNLNAKNDFSIILKRFYKNLKIIQELRLDGIIGL